MLSQELIAKYQIDENIKFGIDRMVIGIPSMHIPKSLYEHTPENEKELPIRKYLRKNYKELQDYIVNGVLIMDYGAKPEKTDTGNRYPVYIDLQDSQFLLCTVHIGNAFGYPFINFEFNPSQLSEEAIEELKLFFSFVLFHQYEELYMHGVVSRCEFYADIKGVNVSELVLIDAGKRRTTHHEDTTYQGPRGAELVGVLYNKADEQRKKDHYIEGDLTRYESRLKDRGTKFCDLIAGKIKNPHSPFIVVTADALREATSHYGGTNLADKIMKYGLYEAMKKNPPARKALINKLRSVAILDADFMWGLHKAMLSEFVPAYIGGGVDEELPIYRESLLI